MHLHWKYRELVKIVVNARTFDEVRKVTLALEAESGEWRRPGLGRQNFQKEICYNCIPGKGLSEAFHIETKESFNKEEGFGELNGASEAGGVSINLHIATPKALLKHISSVQSKVDKLRSELEQMAVVKDKGDEVLYDELDFDYPTSDGEYEELEEEGEEAYLETYGSENDREDESSNLIRNLYRDQDEEPQTESAVLQQHSLEVDGLLSGDDKNEQADFHCSNN